MSDCSNDEHVVGSQEKNRNFQAFGKCKYFCSPAEKNTCYRKKKEENIRKII